jgi:hypothetical protein
LSQTNLLPTNVEHQTAGTGSFIEGDIHDHSDENSQSIGNADSSTLIGNNANYATVQSGENISPQTNRVQENFGVTGITGTGHTINVYQYPEELKELLMKLLTHY